MRLSDGRKFNRKTSICTKLAWAMQLTPAMPDNKVPQRRPKANPVVVLTSEASKFLGGTPNELARKDRKRKASGRYSGDTSDTAPDDTASDLEGTPRKRTLRAFSIFPDW